MRNYIPRQMLLFAVILLTVAVDTADAKGVHRWGKRDTAPYSTSPNRMNILGDEVNDLGRGPLQTFVVQPGETARFLFDVYENEDEYILGGRTVREKGVLHGSMPDFTADLKGTYWKYRPRDFYTIMLDDFYSEPDLFAYEMQVGIDTPEDFYLMEAVLAGMDEGNDSDHKVKWYQAEKFYVEVRNNIPEPSSMALLVTLGVGSLLLPILQRRKRNCETAMERRHAQRPDARRCCGIRGWPWLRKKKKIALHKDNTTRKQLTNKGKMASPPRTEMRRGRTKNRPIESFFETDNLTTEARHVCPKRIRRLHGGNPPASL